MPGLGTVAESAPVGALKAVQTARTPCKDDPELWVSTAHGFAGEMQVVAACGGCRGCGVRLYCAGWAFEMERFHIWAGFTAKDRSAVAQYAPALVKEVAVLVRGLTNVRFAGIRVQRGRPFKIDDELAQTLIARGFAVPQSEDEAVETIIAAGDEVLVELDAALPDALAATVEESPEGEDD